MNVLITGGAGFIGSNFIIYLMNKYPTYNVYCFDKLTYAGDLTNLKDVLKTPEFSFIKGDIANWDEINNIFKEVNFDIVVNFAAESHVDRSIESSDEFIRSNIQGVQILLDACKKYKIKRFHQVSTDEVYGDISDKKTSCTEDMFLNPSSPYAASKAAADLLILSYKRTFNLPITISRCGNNYGKNQFPEKLIPKILINAIRDIPIPIYGTGENMRGWIHVDDHCRAIDLILHSGREGEIYNVGSEKLFSNIYVAKSILNELKKPENLVTLVPDRLGHDFCYSIDCQKIKKETSWTPKIDFQDGLRDTIYWYINNLNRWIK